MHGKVAPVYYLCVSPSHQVQRKPMTGHWRPFPLAVDKPETRKLGQMSVKQASLKCTEQYNPACDGLQTGVPMGRTNLIQINVKAK